MSNYIFTFKKDDIFVEFSTTDKGVVENQFQIWVASADDYVSNSLKKSAKIPNVTPPPIKVEEKKEIETPAAAVVETPVQRVQPAEKPEVFENASNLLKTINTIQEANVGMATQAEITEEIKTQETPVETANFEDVLEKTIENPTFEPIKTKDQVFLNFINSKNTTDKFHYLIITAYYLSEFEKMERFSLKQVNAKLMHNLSEVIDHVALQEAINQNFIELVPDLTGISEVGEYRLTPAGEDFFANKI